MTTDERCCYGTVSVEAVKSDELSRRHNEPMQWLELVSRRRFAALAPITTHDLAILNKTSVWPASGNRTGRAGVCEGATRKWRRPPPINISVRFSFLCRGLRCTCVQYVQWASMCSTSIRGRIRHSESGTRKSRQTNAS